MAEEKPIRDLSKGARDAGSDVSEQTGVRGQGVDRWTGVHHQQRRPDKVIHQPLAESHSDEELMCSHPVVGLECLLISVQVKHCVKEAQHGDAVRHREPPASPWEAGGQCGATG